MARFCRSGCRGSPPAEKINPSYVSRVLRLTLLAPDIVEAILDGRAPVEMTLAVLMRPFAVGWDEQGVPASQINKKAKFETAVK